MTIQQNYPAIKPSLNLDFANTKQLDPRITYSRASTGTYYDGKTVAKAEENLLTFSEQFDNAAWTRASVTVTTNATVSPDGATTADSLIDTAVAGEHTVFQSITSQTTSAFSVYAKYTGRHVALRLYSSVGQVLTVTFDLINGLVSQTNNQGTTFSSVTSTISNVGNGWYRCSVSSTRASGTTFYCINLSNSTTPTINPSNGSPEYTGNGTSGTFIWGAQLEQRSFATAYTPTTTAPITNYIPVLQTASAGTPRFDHNPITGESLGLLIEEQRTNLLLRSEEFNNAAWANSNATVTANTIVSPDGTLDADKVIASAGSAQHYILQNVSIAATGVYTASFYAKSAEYTSFDLWLLNAATADRAVASFNLSTGTTTNGTAGGAAFTGQSSTITPVGNGWYRCTLTATTTGGAINLQSRLFPSSSSTYSGDGTSGIYIWGAQLEAGAFATSYIPTVASQVTRAADSASMTGTNFSSWYNQSEGSFFASMDYMSATTTSWVLAAHSGVVATTNDYLAFVKSSGAAHRQSIVASGASQGNLDVSGAASGVVYKYAGCYKTNDAAFTVGGITPLTDNTVTLLVPNALQLGNLFNQYLNGHISRIAYYPRRLTNTQLQSLTT